MAAKRIAKQQRKATIPAEAKLAKLVRIIRKANKKLETPKPAPAEQWGDDRPKRPAVSQATREHLAYLASVQICDLFEALLAIDDGSIGEGYGALVKAVANPGTG